MPDLVLSKGSSNNELMNCFNKIHALVKVSETEFIVDLDDVWPLAYGRKEEAVRAIKSLFTNGVDYICTKCKSTNGRPYIKFMISYDCFLYLFRAKSKKRKLELSTYIIEDYSSHIYKIGITSDILKRMTQIKTANIYTRLHAIVNVNIESKLHNMFSDKNVSGEWFKLSGNDSNYIVKKFGFILISNNHAKSAYVERFQQ